MTPEEAILELTMQRGPAASICPSEAARLIDPGNWRARLAGVRQAAVHLARSGRIVILRHNKPVDPARFKGVYRLRIAPSGGGSGTI